MCRSAVVITLLLTTAAMPLSGQTPYPQCSAYGSAPFTSSDLNLCTAAIDGAEIFHPVAGLLVSGGNPVLGSIGTLGGFGHFALTARVNGTEVVTPDLSYDGSTTTVGQGDKILAPTPLVEGAIGIFGGVGPMHFLAIDALGSALLLPTTQISGLKVDPGAQEIGGVALGLGYGGRVGVIRGEAMIPSVSLSVMRRDMPRVAYGDFTGGNKYSYGVDLHATNVRAVAGYHLAVFNLGAGFGWDKYTGTAEIAFAPTVGPAQNLNDIELDNTRTMAFLTTGLELPIVKLGMEAGYQFGGGQNLATTFTGNDPSQRRLFAGGGVRLTF